ncbi:MAG: dsbD [Phycisphaerales bacterium]|nr:dsbD [Phycisphaerales bacterium]
MNRFRSIAGLLLVALCVWPAALANAAGQATVTAAADHDHAKAGDSVTIDVTIDVAQGLHAQSHTPNDPNYIPLVLTPKAMPGVTFGTPVYPAGVDETYPGLGTLNVYTGQVVVKLPVKIAADAAGPLKVAGVVRYQACNDTACFPPQRAPFEVTITVESGKAPATTQAAVPPVATPPATQAAVATTAPADAAAVLPPPPAEPAGWLTLSDNSYGLAFAMAFVVGIIFNAVPCVLPVVPLKIAGFYEAAQHDRRKCFMLGLAFSAGLVASFAVLALLVVVLRTLTWGGLFQQTWFTISIVLVLTIMAASQFGLFTINLPTAAYGFSPRHDTYTGNVLFGILTAALSTPCTIGPFSALLTWALARPPVLGAATIVVVGCGMASPYLVMSAFPQVARKFPRTGPVGEIIKQTLAFFVLATAVYFARPLIGSWIAPAAFWWTLFAIVAVACVFLVIRTIRSVGTPRAIAISSVIAAIVALGSGLGVASLARHPYQWQPYTDVALAEAIKTGRPVLIDFTADWCGNCHVLEAWVINDKSIVHAVQTGGVIMLKADVTYGTEAAVPLKDKLVPTGEIPLTAVYLPGQSEPKLLKGIYTTADLLHILDEKKTDSAAIVLSNNG